MESRKARREIKKKESFIDGVIKDLKHFFREELVMNKLFAVVAMFMGTYMNAASRDESGMVWLTIMFIIAARLFFADKDLIG